jgi:hypothetical protein
MCTSSPRDIRCPCRNRPVDSHNSILLLMAPLTTSFFEPIRSDNSKSNNFGRSNMPIGFNQCSVTESLLGHHLALPDMSNLLRSKILSVRRLSRDMKRLKFQLHIGMSQALSSHLAIENSSRFILQLMDQRPSKVQTSRKTQNRRCLPYLLKYLPSHRCHLTTAHIQMLVVSL